MLHFIEGFLAGCPVWLPAGMYAWYRYGFGLKADAQKVETAVTNFKPIVKGKAS